MINGEISLLQLSEKMHKCGYIHKPQLAMQVYSALKQDPVSGAFLFGCAGSGKSFLPEVLKNILGSHYYFYQICPGTREEDLVQKMLPSEHTRSGIKLTDGAIVQASRKTLEGKRVMLVLDEWDKSRHSADAFLLDFLQTGRISFPGVDITANLSNLTVFITMNDERELSEPLMRRLPMINFSLMHPDMVRTALLATHPDEDMVEPVVTLYQKCVIAKIKKPITIQEMRQLLDAITFLGDSADWNTLVYQYITKTPENHRLLRENERRSIQNFPEEVNSSLKTVYYDSGSNSVPEVKHIEEEMPKVAHLRNFKPKFRKYPAKEDFHISGKGIWGLIDYSQDAYNSYVYDFAEFPRHRAASLFGSAYVKGRYIVITKPVPLRNYYKLSKLRGIKGEICFVEYDVHWTTIKNLIKYGLTVVKFQKSEIIGKRDNDLHIRWKRKAGLLTGRVEVIVNICKPKVSDLIFGVDQIGGEQHRPNMRWLSGSANESQYERHEIGWVYRKHLDAGWTPRPQH